MKRLLWAILLLPLLGCGDSTEPLLLSGSWRFSYNNMTGSSQGFTVACSVGAVDFTITQSGNSFSGVQSGSARLSCTILGQIVADEQITAETIVNGQLADGTVTFRLGRIEGQHIGTLSGTSMVGTAQWVLSQGNATVTLNGEFTAAKL